MVRALDKADAMLMRVQALYNIGSHLPFYSKRNGGLVPQLTITVNLYIARA